jgi:hypothetical protein
MNINFNNDLSFSDKMFHLSKNIILNLNIFNIQDKIQIKNEDWTPHTLDLNNGIDGLLVVNNKNYSFQEKIRRYKNYQYKDFTMEYYSNHEDKVEWEIFHLDAMYYIHWYCNEDETEIIELRILYIPKIKEILRNNFNHFLKTLKYNKLHSKASFFTIPLKLLDEENATMCLIRENKIIYIKN